MRNALDLKRGYSSMRNKFGSAMEKVDYQGVSIRSRGLFGIKEGDPLGWTGPIIGLVFILITMALMILGVSTYRSTSALYSKGERVTATVQEHRVRNYRDSDGNQRTTTTSVLTFADRTGQIHEMTHHGELPIGHTRQVIYLPDDPKSAKIIVDNPFYGPIIAIALGIVLFCLSLFGTYSSLAMRKRALHLIEHGKKVMARIIAVNNTPRYSSRRRRGRGNGLSIGRGGISIGSGQNGNQVVGHDSEIVAQWRDSEGKTHTFLSYKITYYVDPGLCGKNIPVFLDPTNPKEYYLSARCLLELQEPESSIPPEHRSSSESQPGQSIREIGTDKPLF